MRRKLDCSYWSACSLVQADRDVAALYVPFLVAALIRSVPFENDHHCAGDHAAVRRTDGHGKGRYRPR